LAANPEKAAVDDEPVIVVPPGEAVSIHGVVGNPLNNTLPVDTIQVGWVTVPVTGAEGVTGWALIATLGEAREVQPVEFKVTVKV